MTVAYSDELGVVEVQTDADGVSFVDGVAYFSDGDTDYKVAMSALIAVY